MISSDPALDFDWEAAYARLARTRAVLEGEGGRSAADVAEILQQRARQLARPVATAQEFEEPVDLLVFSVAAVRYALETARVAQVVPLGSLTPVPGAPAFLRGLLYYRGGVLPVLDLAHLLDVAGKASHTAAWAVAVGVDHVRFALLADEVGEVVRAEGRELMPPPAAWPESHRALMRGLTPDRTVLLDLAGLARSPRIVVRDGIG